MTLREYFAVFRERWVVVVACVLVGVLAALVLTLLTPRRYSSEAIFYIATQGGDSDASAAYDATMLAREKIASYVELLGDPRVGQDVVDRLRDVDAASPAISAETVPDTSLIRTTVTARSPQQAQRVAAAVGDEFVVLVAQLEQQAGAQPGAPTVVARVVRPPSFSASPVSPSTSYDLTLGLAAGLVLGLLTALAWHQLDNTVKSGDVLGKIAKAPALGSVVDDPAFAEHPVGVHENSQSAYAEAYRHVRTNLGFLGVDSPRKILVGSSALPDEGKSATLCNLASVLGQEGYRTLLVSADLRRPKVEAYLQIEAAVGLTTILTGRSTLDDCVQPWAGGEFDVLAAGALPPNPSEMLGSRKMAELMTELRERYDIVLLDAPPLIPVTDAVVLGSRADGVILMARHGGTTKNDLGRALARLAAADVPVVGTILTRAPESQLRPYWGYLAISAADAEVPASRSLPEALPSAPAHQPDARAVGESEDVGHDGWERHEGDGGTNGFEGAQRFEDHVTEERFVTNGARTAAEERAASVQAAPRQVPSPRPRIPLVARSAGDAATTAVDDKP
ncbi:polysaccharide biosynthesis tyrosine autokinase [Actinomycetospora rhizophila]|uniref:non-specific protein-tyrosine kinase n=1 Tax=Actinomycetospora rhizophila TaxID=1416876 RepID=A0ABV9ZL60_9PSEU